MNVPKLRFKADDGSEFPEWEEKTFSEILSENKIPIPKPTNGYERLGIRSHGKGTFHEYVPAGEGLDVDTMYVVEAYNLILNITFAWEQAIAVTDDKDDGKLVSHRFPQYKFNDGFDWHYFKYDILDKKLKHELGLASPGGAGRNRVLNKSDFLKIKRVVPCLNEQKKIASFLSTIDEIITTSEAELTAWQECKKGVIQKIFNREVRFKADDGTDFPEWEEAEIGKVGTFIKGAALSKADISDTGTPFVLYGELYTTYKEIAYTIKRKTEAVVDEKYYSKIGDVVIPTSGESPEEISTATCIMVPNVILAGDLNIFRSSIIDGRIMSYILNYQAKNKIATIAQGKSIVHIQAKELSKIKIKFPIDVNEQCKIADCLSSLDDVINQIQAELSAWKEFKKGLLQRMFV